MICIVDEQLSPHLAIWITNQFNVKSYSAEYLNLDSSSDDAIFFKARELNAIVITKDEDFCNLLSKYGPPPKIIWITCGNTSNENLRRIFIEQFDLATSLLEGLDLVEIG